MLLRALSYEERLTGRAGLDVHVGVVGREQDPGSERSAFAMSLAFQTQGNLYVHGLPVKASQLAYQGPEPFAALLERRGIDVVYVCPGLEPELARILESRASDTSSQSAADQSTSSRVLPSARSPWRAS